MLTKIEVVNAADELLALDMFDSSNGYSLARVEGLEPVQASFSSSTLASLVGESYQSNRIEKRNILITLDFEPDYESTSVRELRRGLYAFFMPGAEVLLRFDMSDVGVLEILARVESFDTSLFEQDPQAIISLLCFNPYFRKSGVEVEYGDFGTPASFVYKGSVPSGLEANFTIGQAFSDFEMVVTNVLYGTRTMSVNFDFEFADQVRIATTPGWKKVTLLRGGQTTSLLPYLLQSSVWPLLAPGNNEIVTDSENITSAPYPHVEYRFVTLYGGL